MAKFFSIFNRKNKVIQIDQTKDSQTSDGKTKSKSKSSSIVSKTVLNKIILVENVFLSFEYIF